MFMQDKIRFVDECYPDSEMSRKWILSSLSILSDYEEDWGMDFTMQEYQILQDAFNKVTAITYSGSKTTLIRFRKYAKWRKENNLPCSDGVFNLVADRAIAMRESMVASPKELATVLDAAFDDSIQGTIDVIYRVFLWMGFAGISDYEAIKVTSDDIDFSSMEIHHAGKDYIIYEESKYDFRIACDIREFKENNRYKKRIEGSEIMRGKQNKRSNPMDVVLTHTIRPTLARKLEAADQRNQASDEPLNVGFDLTFSRVFMSGTFYRIYQNERAGVKPDFEQYAIDEFERVSQSDKPYKVSQTNPKSAILLRLKKSAESDYSNWKKAFLL